MAQEKPNNSTLFSMHAPLPVAQLDDEQRIACLRLVRSANIGPVTFRELINHFGGAQQAIEGLPGLSGSGRRGKRIKLCSREDAEAELDAARVVGATPVFTIEPGYPLQLAHMPVPPPLIYTLGDARLLARPAIGIVGARLASAAGTKLARIFAKELGEGGLVVVSGLARGIDRVAHEGALETGTVAVVAGGVDVIYPPEHEDLHRRISETGCIVAEMPCGFKPRAKDFPRRNRIISGLSLGVLVVEAAFRSGSLVTARHALEQDRERFAIPGHPLDPRAKGTNSLLKNGATFVTEPSDILDALRPIAGDGWQGFREPRIEALTAIKGDVLSALDADAACEDETAAFEPETVVPESAPRAVPKPAPTAVGCSIEHSEIVRGVLSVTPVDQDAILRASGLGVRQVRAAILELELGGEIERHGANLISLRPT